MNQKKENEISINRSYDAPIKVVWEAWTDPKQVAQWWGPRGFTLTTHHKNVETGGSWKYLMHGPDGTDFPNYTKFLEVKNYSRMVYDHGGSENKPPMFRVTVDFSEQSGKTEMRMIMALPTAEAATNVRQFIKKANGDSTWDRLAEFLSPTDKFVINRSFNLPMSTMFEMWTDPKHFSQWMPPSGFKMERMRSEVKEGGSTFSCMTGPGDAKMCGKAKYLEITRPTRLVYTQVFCDENEKTVRHPLAPTWPETMLTKVNFTEEENSQTRITLSWEIFGEATQAERETFSQAKIGIAQGWNGSFDKLETYLDERQ